MFLSRMGTEPIYEFIQKTKLDECFFQLLPTYMDVAYSHRRQKNGNHDSRQYTRATISRAHDSAYIFPLAFSAF